MNVVVDTSVWSLALRRRRVSAAAEARELAELVREGRAVVIGPVRQELLSGISDTRQFEAVREALRAFPDLSLVAEDYETAATFFNQCRANGIQGSNTDFLIVAAAARHKLGVLTTDADFVRFARWLPLALHAPRASLGA
ncbi:MAG TPA: PIN domain-containing protein [Polyangia bacterium]|jgi:predicted nucleic acid-binding protein|nr:PIN domain-containing protein [Polyangia bacterium]